MSEQTYDVVIVGASLAGCAAATLLAREGVKVAVVERHAKPETHKQLCTHFIQASALPVLKRLGLDRLIEEAGGLRNAAEFHTPYGWVGGHLGTDDDGKPWHGYNIRRLRLDPMVREMAANTPGVTMLLGTTAKSLIEQDGRIVGVELGGATGHGSLHARLVVAADGRHSALAAQAGAETKSAPNTRFGVMAPMRNVDLKRGNTSQMWMTGPEVAYVFPNDDGVTVLAWMMPKDQFEQYRDQPLEALKARMATLPDAPTLQHAELAGDVLTAKDFPGLWRPPVVRGMALIGDAAMSLDYQQGVGCGWAFQSAGWLCDAVSSDLKHSNGGAASNDLAAGLKRYEKQHATLAGHRFVINDVAGRLHFTALEKLMFSAAAKDMKMAQHVARFGARIDGLGTFMAPSALLRAVWVNVRPSAAPAMDTRLQ